MKIRMIGDVHGKYNRYHKLISEVPHSIQVGDMGVGFRVMRQGELKSLPNPSFDKMSKGDHKFIRGNHDNPNVCKYQKHWIPDGTFHNKVFCIGGAASIDWAMRIPGETWWEDEELSYKELVDIIDIYRHFKPRYVVTHDCPESIANEILYTLNKRKIDIGIRTRTALEEMFYYHQPECWWFGHWHESLTFERNGTRFRCLSELEHEDWEIEKEIIND